MSTPHQTANRTLTLMLAGAGIVMGAVMVWGAMQAEDPLAPFIQTDKIRHILAFGAVGLCAGLMPLVRARLMSLAAVLAFGVVIEAIQIPLPDRTASIEDLLASIVGALAGFGAGAAALATWEQLRESVTGRSTSASPRR